MRVASSSDSDEDVGACDEVHVGLLPYVRACLWPHQPTRSAVETTWHRMIYQVPARAEKFITLGVLVCIDDLLWTLAVLPLHMIIAVVRAGVALAKRPFSKDSSLPRSDAVVQSLLLACSTALFYAAPHSTFDYSDVYHWIRQEPVLKLYVLYTVWEIFDKLLSGVGPDILAALTVNRLGSGHTYLRFASCVGITVVHAGVLLAQCATLNAAMNSDTTLFSILVSQNFAELKISVFKSSNREALFQTACNDAVERYKFIMFFTVVLLHSNRNDCGGLEAHDVILLFAMEMIVDWVKHFFITRHSGISCESYDRMQYTLARCVLRGSAPAIVGGESSTQWVAHKVGGCACPMVVVLLRVGLGYAKALLERGEVEFAVLSASLSWAALLLLKQIVNVLCVGWAARVDNRERMRLAQEHPAAPLISPRSISLQPPTRLRRPSDGYKAGAEAEAHHRSKPQRRRRRRDVDRDAQAEAEAVRVCEAGAEDEPKTVSPSNVPPPDPLRGIGRFTMVGKQIPFM